MSPDEWVGYAMVLGGVLVACAIFVGVVLWVVLGLMHPWAERTVAKHIEAADATEWPELDDGHPHMWREGER